MNRRMQTLFKIDTIGKWHESTYIKSDCLRLCMWLCVSVRVFVLAVHVHICMCVCSMYTLSYARSFARSLCIWKREVRCLGWLVGWLVSSTGDSTERDQTCTHQTEQNWMLYCKRAPVAYMYLIYFLWI